MRYIEIQGDIKINRDKKDTILEADAQKGKGEKRRNTKFYKEWNINDFSNPVHSTLQE